MHTIGLKMTMTHGHRQRGSRVAMTLTLNFKSRISLKQVDVRTNLCSNARKKGAFPGDMVFIN